MYPHTDQVPCKPLINSENLYKEDTKEMLNNAFYELRKQGPRQGTLTVVYFNNSNERIISNVYKHN